MSPAARWLPISPAASAADRQYPLSTIATPCNQPDLSGSEPYTPLPPPLISRQTGLATSHRWIRANAARDAFQAAYKGNRTVTQITPIKGEYAFDDLLTWFRTLDRAMLADGIYPSAGAV